MANIDTENNEKIVIYAEKDLQNGILGFFNCVRREEKGKSLRYMEHTQTYLPKKIFPGRSEFIDHFSILYGDVFHRKFDLQMFAHNG